MSKKTNIQWCDSTVNPVMGCGGCELFPKAPRPILAAIDRELIEQRVQGWKRGRARRLIKDLLAEAWKQLLEMIGEPGIGHINEVTTTNIYHLRKRFEERVSHIYGKSAGTLGRHVIERTISCYAAKLHLNKGYSVVNPLRKPNVGYAPTFEQVTKFAGRMGQAAAFPDMLGVDRVENPWLNGLARLIFISDMGDALTHIADEDFLKRELDETQTDAGQRHLWLWLTKRPERMKRFAASIGGLPTNLCAMTTITSTDTLHRVDYLRETDAHVRALSVEPLWTSIADDLDLTGIDWVIVGGESGAKKNAAPFCVEWGEELKVLCQEQGVAFFFKQLGRQPTRGGAEIILDDKHGGDWNEWDDSLRVRDLPAYFHAYRQEEKPSLTC